MPIKNGLKLTKERSRRYLAKTITNADYADDIALLANEPTQAETLLHSLERAATGRAVQVKTHKTEYMCFNQTGDIFTLTATSPKLVDKFTYLESSVSSTEIDIDTRLAKPWTAIIGLSVIWKLDLTDKMKRSFFQAAVVSILLYGWTTWMLTKSIEKKLDVNFRRMLRAILNKSWKQHPTKQQLYDQLSRKLSKLDEPEMRTTAGEVETIYCWGPLLMDEQRQNNQHEPACSSFLPIRDVVQKTYRKQWTIGKVAREGQRYPCW